MNVVALAGDHRFLNKIETAIKSIFWHNPGYKIYLINPDIPHEWFVNINQYVNQFGSKVIDSKFDLHRLAKEHSSYKRINEMTYAKYLIPELIKENKVLYLDSDLVIDHSLDKLFDLSFDDGQMLYATKDYIKTDEVNAGVMLINNKKWQKDGVVDKILKLGQNPDLSNGDQTVINNFFKNKIGELDLKYNYQVGSEIYIYWNKMQESISYLENTKDPVIIHYTTENKPDNLLPYTHLREQWWYYHNLTWADIVNKFNVFDRRKIHPLTFKKEALLHTHLANTRDIEYLIKNFPDIHFNIAAYTQMAWELVKLTQYDNVQLYPLVIGSLRQELIDKADIYLDINYGQKEKPVLDKIKKRNIPMLAFNDTKDPHSEAYSKYFIYDNREDMVKKIKDLIR